MPGAATLARVAVLDAMCWQDGHADVWRLKIVVVVNDSVDSIEV